MSKVLQTEDRKPAAEVMYELARLIHTGQVPAPHRISIAGTVQINVGSLAELDAWREFLGADKYEDHQCPFDGGTLRWRTASSEYWARDGWTWEATYTWPVEPAPAPDAPAAPLTDPIGEVVEPLTDATAITITDTRRGLVTRGTRRIDPHALALMTAAGVSPTLLARCTGKAASLLLRAASRYDDPVPGLTGPDRLAAVDSLASVSLWLADYPLAHVGVTS